MCFLTHLPTRFVFLYQKTTPTSWEHLKIGAAHLSSGNFSMNHTGGITENFKQFMSHSTKKRSPGDSLVFRKVSDTEEFFIFKCIGFLNEHFFPTVSNNFGENLFLCLWAPVRRCFRPHLHALKKQVKVKIDYLLWFQKNLKMFRLKWRKSDISPGRMCEAQHTLVEVAFTFLLFFYWIVKNAWKLICAL